ncbi:unnamed protein product [Symbiodinium sp. CCMP2456]|nr:unnamed protein product [Symbiodinium sp. CCMP2456]
MALSGSLRIMIILRVCTDTSVKFGCGMRVLPRGSASLTLYPKIVQWDVVWQDGAMRQARATLLQGSPHGSLTAVLRSPKDQDKVEDLRVQAHGTLLRASMNGILEKELKEGDPPGKSEMAQLSQGTAFRYKPSVGSWLQNRPYQVAPPRHHTVYGDYGETEDYKASDTVPWPLASLEDISSKQPDQAAKEAQGEQEEEERWSAVEPEVAWWDSLGLLVCCFGRGYA